MFFVPEKVRWVAAADSISIYNLTSGVLSESRFNSRYSFIAFGLTPLSCGVGSSKNKKKADERKHLQASETSDFTDFPRSVKIFSLPT